MRCKFTSSLLLTAFVALPSLLAQPAQLENNHVELHRRDDIGLRQFYHVDSDQYDDVNFKIFPICNGDNIVEKRNYKDDFVNEMKNRGTGVYNGEWFKLSKAPHVNLPEGCYEKTDGPTTTKGAALEPFVSVVTSLRGAGSVIYLKELDGKPVGPNGKIHNGCVVVADELSNIDDVAIYMGYDDQQNYFGSVQKITWEPQGDCPVQTY